MTNVEGAKFPLYLTDEEWWHVVVRIWNLASSSGYATANDENAIKKLKEQLEKLGVKV